MNNQIRTSLDIAAKSTDNKGTTKLLAVIRARQTSRFFCACLMAKSRLYDGLREPNKTPSGNKFRRLEAVVDYPSPYYGGDLLTKLLGGHHA